MKKIAVKNSFKPKVRTFKQCAFTLAEVLITLSIIGVVAALTIPSVVNKNNETETVISLKKAYSVLSQAYNMAIASEGTDANNASTLFDGMGSNLSIMKDCETGAGCFANGMYKHLSGSDFTNINELAVRKYRLTDGSSVFLEIYSDDCTHNSGNNRLSSSVCGAALVDINGDKKPNTLGKDTYIFYVTKTGIIPFGVADDTAVDSCDKTTGGYGCAAWVIQKENQDYLK